MCLSTDLAPFPGQVAVLAIPGTPLETQTYRFITRLND